MPIFIAPVILWGLGRLYWALAFNSRKIVAQNLRLLGTQKNSTFGVFHHFGLFLYEFFSLKKPIIYEEEKLLQQFNQSFGGPGEKGGLLLLPHLGNWELALRWILDQGYQVDTIAHQHSSPEIDEIFHNLRAHPHLKVHPLEQGGRACLKAIKQKRIVALACERDYTGQGEKVTFEDFSTHFPSGPTWLMRAKNCETKLIECKRLSLLKFEIQIHPFNLEGDPQDGTRQLAQAIYKLIRKHPLQWITFDPILKPISP